MSKPTKQQPPSLDLTTFPSIFPSHFPYTKPRLSKIRHHRTLLDNILFYDLLLTDHVHGLPSTTDLYPPKNLQTLQLLFQTIMDSTADSLKKYSFVYYLLNEYHDDQSQKEHALTSRYATKAHIPPHFVSMMDAIWALDNGDIETAVHHLSNPAVIPPYPDKILSTLLKHGNPHLAITFVHITQPSLLSDTSVAMYFNALKAINVEAAFVYQRTAPLHLRQSLFKSLVDHCLTHKRDENAMILINLPLNTQEQDLFESHLKSSNIPVAKDTLLIKQIHQGNLTEVLPETLSISRLNEPRVGGTNWGDLARGISLGMGPRTSEYH